MSEGIKLRINEGSGAPSFFLLFLLVVFSAGTLVFAGLWLYERHRGGAQGLVAASPQVAPQPATEPSKAIKEVQVPARLSREQEAALTLARRVSSAPAARSEDEALHNIDSIRLNVILDDSVKKAVSEEQITNKLGALFLQTDVKVDKASDVVAGLTVQGFWEDDETVLTYSMTLVVVRDVIVLKGEDARKCTVAVWRDGFFARVGKAKAEEALLKRAGLMAANLANKLHAARSREMGPAASK